MSAIKKKLRPARALWLGTLWLATLAAPMSQTKAAESLSQFHGVWGTAKQCNREPIIDGGTRLAEPIEINANWLRQGDIWCQLTWFPVEHRSTQLFTGAFVRCGEDAVRDYLVRMFLKDQQLSLSWDLSAKGDQLERCS